MRLHLVGLPHTEVTEEYSWCAYTQKVRRMRDMMTSLGHEVTLYTAINPGPNTWGRDIPEFNEATFGEMNANVINGLTDSYIQPGDLILLSAGRAQKPIADAFPDVQAVEFGVGYGGVFSDYRVFESYAWMHTVYGALYGSDCDGRFYDAVIPNSYHSDEFPFGAGGEGYALYMGRLTDRKGYQLAADVAMELKLPLKVAGPGKPPGYGEYVGVVYGEDRVKLLQGATALLAPTLYVEPFGGVAVEAMMCGTPVITTDWGGFTETVTQGVTGFRCHTFGEFLEAARLAPLLNRVTIHKTAQRWSTEVIKYRYEEYFQRVLGLKEPGHDWFDKSPGAIGALR